MVQYVFTPWRSRRELLAVRRQFYPEQVDATAGTTDTDTDTDTTDRQRAAVARVSIWMQRGSCPHMVESTALLVAAGLSDAAEGSSTAAYAVRATYAAAFSRFVTGLLDGQQDRARKLSMYNLARSIGLPAAFVELRHQATHESLPSLARLRAAARRALQWIWQYYWVRLGGLERPKRPERKTGLPVTEDPCRAALLRYADETPSAEAQADAEALAPIVQTWGRARVLVALAGVSAIGDDGTTTDQSRARMLRCLRLSQVLWSGSSQAPQPAPVPTVDLDSIRAKVEDEVDKEDMDDQEEEDGAMAVDAPEQELQTPASRPRWTRYEGEWKPRPIGVV